jgi:hypothetical protein
MSEVFKNLSIEVENLDSIENWNDKISKMKEIKEKILLEKQKLSELVNVIVKNESKTDENKKKKNKQDFDSLLLSFKNANTIEEKIKLYQLISSHINDVEKELFSN